MAACARDSACNAACIYFILRELADLDLHHADVRPPLFFDALIQQSMIEIPKQHPENSNTKTIRFIAPNIWFE